MSAHGTIGNAIFGLLALAIGVLVIYLLVRWFRRTFSKLGLTPGEIGFILWATFLGAFINIPLYPFGDGWIGINVGGGVVPVAVSLYLIRKKALPLNEVFVGAVLVTAVAYLVTDYVPGVGVLSPFPLWLLPAVTAFAVTAVAYWNERDNAAGLAYVVGTLGVLIGADLLRLPEILAGPPPGEGAILSIGGAAAFDMVYLTGILAVSLETGLLVKQRQNLSRTDALNAIDAEYEAWVKRKENEWADVRRERDRLRQEDPRLPRSADSRTNRPRTQPSQPRATDWRVIEPAGPGHRPR